MKPFSNHPILTKLFHLFQNLRFSRLEFLSLYKILHDFLSLINIQRNLLSN